jgi:O-acetylhomoserine/O-acetylserine sulfhydrylase-like pyridoxal-dependent enzyme
LPNPIIQTRSKNWLTKKRARFFVRAWAIRPVNICDVEALAAVAARHGIPLVVDNTVATPILLRPMDYSADIVVYSLTKFMGGHGTTLGGAIVDSGRFPWPAHARRFPMFNEPDTSYHGLVYTEHFGAAGYIARCRSVYQRTTGGTHRASNSTAARGISQITRAW